jgi:hypothetical protein
VIPSRPAGPPFEITRTTRTLEKVKGSKNLKITPRALQELPTSTRVDRKLPTSTKKDIKDYTRDNHTQLPPQKKEGPPHGVLWIEKRAGGARPSQNYEGSIIGEEREDRFLYYKKAVDEEHAKSIQKDLGKYGVQADAFRKQRVNRMKRKPVTRKPVRKVAVKKKVVRRR